MFLIFPMVLLVPVFHLQVQRMQH